MGTFKSPFWRGLNNSLAGMTGPNLPKTVGKALLRLAPMFVCVMGAAAQQTIWPGTSVPSVIDNGPDGPLELGVSFKSDTAGTITGIRFYKSANNTGAHVGHLWSHSGALLASVTFSEESASGWQQANFSNPVSIAANTVYVASYQSSVGHWSVDWNYFASSGADNAPLHAIQNGAGAPNGIWGTAGAAPTNTNASNYWVDVVFKNKTVAPSITSQPVSQTVVAGQTATFSVTASGTSLKYQWKKNGTAIGGATSATYTTPAAAATDSGTQFSVVVSNSTGSVTSSAATLTVNVPVAQQTIWPSTAVPGTVDSGPSSAVELGVSFKSDASGTISGIRFYKASTNTGTHVGHLWTSTGTLLASVTFSAESASGWQQANFSAPVTIKANTVYVASYQSSVGHWSVDWNYFAAAGVNTPPLHAVQNGAGAPNGVWGSPGTFPANTNASNYWVDVAFNGGAATAPSISTQPANQTVTAGQSATFSVVASGTAPLSYQWRKNGTAISGATSAGYTTPTTTSTDNGAQFSVVVANSAGSVTSNSATVTVSAATATLSASPTTLNFGNTNTGSSSSLSVTLTNSGNSTVTISSVTSTTGFTASDVSAGTILNAGQSATLNVSFAPTTAGSVSGNITVASNATNSPLVVTLSGAGVQQSANFPVWVMPSLNRVGKTDAAGTTSAITLSGARGETVDTQVVVQGPASGLTNVNLTASALTGPNGVTIPVSSVTLYREYYITVTGTANYGGGSNPPQGSGTYPEPLIPFNDPETGSALCGSSAVLKACNVAISSGQNQPYWIDISVPHGASTAPPGTYTGTINVTADQGSASIQVTLTVWNFELPMQPTELSLWTLWSPASGNTTATLAQALMRNKVMGWYDVASNASSDVANMGLNRSGLDSYYYIGIQCNGSYSYLPTSGQISSAAANFPAGLPLDFYVADELNGCTADYSPIKTMGMNAHAASPAAKTMMTINAPDPNLYNEGDGRSAIDHWVLLDSVQQWPSLPFTGGGDLWSYTSCNAGYGNTPEWMVDYPPINERVQAGFLNWAQGASGILYYRADGWTSGNAIGSWDNVDTTACGGGLGRPGDGIFVYPPAPIASTESAPGIRLKAIRDGIQDYEYAHMLTNLGQLSFVNSVLQPIAGSWTNWTHDPNALVNARLQLGQQLDLLHP